MIAPVQLQTITRLVVLTLYFLSVMSGPSKTTTCEDPLVSQLISPLQNSKEDNGCVTECLQNEFDAKDKASLSTDDSQCIDKPAESVTSAVVLFRPTFLRAFREESKQFTFIGRTIVIKQKWEDLGVAAVVWDACTMDSLPQRCVCCIFTTTNSATLSRHYKEKHPNYLRLYKCNNLGCGYETKKPSNLRRHLTTCKLPRYVCPHSQCGFTTQSTIDFNRHRQDQHKGQKARSPSTVSIAASENLFDSPVKQDNTSPDVVQRALAEILTEVGDDDLSGSPPKRVRSVVSVVNKANSTTTAPISPPRQMERAVVQASVSQPLAARIPSIAFRKPEETTQKSAELPDPRLFKAFDGVKAASELSKTLEGFRNVAQLTPASHQLRTVESSLQYETVFEWVRFSTGVMYGQTRRRWKLPDCNQWGSDMDFADPQLDVPSDVLPPLLREL